MKHPQDTSNDERANDGWTAKNVFFVCFRYFQRVNIEAKIIDWVLTVLCFSLLAPFHSLIFIAFFTVLSHTIFDTCSSPLESLRLLTRFRWTHWGDWNMPPSPIKSPNPSTEPFTLPALLSSSSHSFIHSPLSPLPNMKILEKSFPWTEN